MALIDRVNWSGLDMQVTHQQRNRSAHAPVISLYRWWARRPHCFVGALLEAAKKEFRRGHFLVADPFSGGGTVAFEAARRSLPIYAQDLYPWPSKGLATALTPADPEEFRSMAEALLKVLSPLRKRYWQAKSTDTWETTHVVRVRSGICPECSNRLFLFREPLISLASRRAEESYAFFGCCACGAVSRRRKDVRSFSCDSCDRHEKTEMNGASARTPEIRCPHCSKCLQLSELLLSSLAWRPVLLCEQLLSETKLPSRLRIVERTDPVEDIREVAEHPLHTQIPDGLETAALKRYGFLLWDQLYTKRQLETITSALDAVPALKATAAVKEHLRLAILGATEMAGYVCRWERYNPKAVEAIANHRFSRSTVTVETNLLSTSGRGTLPRRFEAVEKALRWMNAEGYPAQTIHAESSARRRSVNGALIVTGSSNRQLLRDGAANLIFTDPPYHDDLQYGELARLFHAWMKHAGYCEKPLESEEAVPNSVRGATTKHYEDKVAACLTESRRALSSEGRLVLTFHNKDLNAWEALAQALLRASFDVVALATVAAENSADHSKRGKQSFLSDLVIECRPKRAKRRRSWRLEVHGVTSSPQRRNLETIGLALAECVNRREGDLEALFDTHFKRLKLRQRLIRRGGK
jgi:putative DNA methylase